MISKILSRIDLFWSKDYLTVTDGGFMVDSGGWSKKCSLILLKICSPVAKNSVIFDFLDLTRKMFKKLISNFKFDQ